MKAEFFTTLGHPVRIRVLCGAVPATRGAAPGRSGDLPPGGPERIWSTIADDRHPDLDVVIIRMSELEMLDATGAHTLAQVAEDLEARGITVIIKGVQPEHLRLLANVGAIGSLRHENHLIEGIDEAIDHARSHVRRSGADAPRPAPR